MDHRLEVRIATQRVRAPLAPEINQRLALKRALDDPIDATRLAGSSWQRLTDSPALTSCRRKPDEQADVVVERSKLEAKTVCDVLDGERAPDRLAAR